MPPGRKNILKSGNAGNSPKARHTEVQDGQTEKALFPTGYKYPLSLLHERYFARFLVHLRLAFWRCERFTHTTSLSCAKFTSPSGG
jgi:hypothetical protein